MFYNYYYYYMPGFKPAISDLEYGNNLLCGLPMDLVTKARRDKSMYKCFRCVYT